MSFLGELRRRNVVKVAVAYAIVGWVLVQVSDVLLPAFGAPDWVLPVFVLLLSMGFVVALILSWAYELTPEGMKRSHEVPATESITHVTGRKIDFAIIGALVLALGFVVYNYVLEDADGRLPNSVAVLPFDNLSPDPDNAYFAAGIHEEILNQLAKLRALNVIARTSMLRYAETDKSIPEIANELNVETVMEGSVRYAGDRVRITAQLINPDTGAHLWTETYDREFADVFAVESDIAMNIANALEAEFSLEEQGKIEAIPTKSPEAYALYLKAVSEPWTSPASTRSRLEPLFLAAIELDQDFALAHAWLAFVYARELEEALTLRYAQRALELDPELAIAYAAITLMYSSALRFDEALEFAEQGLQISPADPDVLGVYARSLQGAGHETEGIRALERAIQFDPANWLVYQELGWQRWQSGDREGGTVAMRGSVELAPEQFINHRALGMMEAVLGDAEEGIAQLQLAVQLAGAFEELTPVTAFGYRVVGLHDEAARLAGLKEERTSTGCRVIFRETS